MSDCYLWKFYWDCGRQGELESLVVATEEEIKGIIGREAHFGEVLGKHSDIYGTLEEGDFTKLNISPEAVDEVSEILGNVWSGYNPFEFARYECPICGDTYCGYDWDDDKNCCIYCERKEKE